MSKTVSGLGKKQLPGDGGYVYFSGPRDGDVVKIGRTADPEGVGLRMRGLQAQSPLELDCFGAIPALDARDLAATEADLHLFFAAERRHGEWFARTARIESAISYVVRTYGRLEAASLIPQTVPPLRAVAAARQQAVDDWRDMVDEWLARHSGLAVSARRPPAPLEPHSFWDCAGIELDGSAQQFAQILFVQVRDIDAQLVDGERS